MRRCVIYQDVEGRYRWRLIAARGGKIIAESGQGRGYSRRIDAEQMFESIVDMRHTEVEIIHIDGDDR